MEAFSPLLIGQSDYGGVFLIEAPTSQMTLACVNLTKETSQSKYIIRLDPPRLHFHHLLLLYAFPHVHVVLCNTLNPLVLPYDHPLGHELLCGQPLRHRIPGADWKGKACFCVQLQSL